MQSEELLCETLWRRKYWNYFVQIFTQSRIKVRRWAKHLSDSITDDLFPSRTLLAGPVHGSRASGGRCAARVWFAVIHLECNSIYGTKGTANSIQIPLSILINSTFFRVRAPPAWRSALFELPETPFFTGLEALAARRVWSDLSLWFKAAVVTLGFMRP